MDSLDYWRLCAEMNIIQAALLVAGCDPSEKAQYVEGWEMDKRPPGYEAAKTAILNAFRRGAINGKVDPEYGSDGFGNECPLEDTVSLQSLIEVESLRAWLKGRGFNTGFFFPNVTDAPDYLDPNNPRYAPKLAAAVRAWQAVTDPGKRSAKQALEKWLKEHAAEFGLVDEDGKPVKQAVEECSKVANWDRGGGAPKTPG